MLIGRVSIRRIGFVRNCAQLASTSSCRELFLLPEGTVTETEVRNAYRTAARRLHPDRGGKSEEFQELQDCYHSLLAELGKGKKERPEWLEKMKKDFANFSCC